MFTQLCHYLLPNPRRQAHQRQRRSQTNRPSLKNRLNEAVAGLSSAPRGQVMVIFAVSLIALIAFVGLVVDAGSVYVSYGQLKRAVDTAAVAAANEFKRGATKTIMFYSAQEILRMQNVDLSTVDLKVFICDADGDGLRDASLNDPASPNYAPQLYARCPDTANGEVPRKLVWVDAKQKAPLYFLSLLGVNAVNLETNAISEAASVNLVIVLDTSGSMDSDVRTPGYDPNNDDPNAPGHCNVALTPSISVPGYQAIQCYPLRDALEAAASLVSTMYDKYDMVGIVTFSKEGKVVTAMTTNMNNAISAIYSIKVNADIPTTKMWHTWPVGSYNPINPEDMDGSNVPKAVYNDLNSLNHNTCTLNTGRWDTLQDPFGWGGVPCVDSTHLDAFDWNGNGIFEASDENTTAQWLNHYICGSDGCYISVPPSAADIKTKLWDTGYMKYLSFNDTCTGCGIRVASNLLRSSGSPTAVWVMIVLSDGAANMSDTQYTFSDVPQPEGFCGGSMGTTNRLWSWLCINYQSKTRYCIQADHGQAGHVDRCPPGTNDAGNSHWVDPTIDNTFYTPENYARDMIDQAALTKSSNPNEASGNDIAVYTIGLGDSVGQWNHLHAWQPASPDYADPEGLLRYMAAVGDDGDRTTDPCSGKPEHAQCGNYYYAAKGDGLRKIFDDIASRIYTRITQ